MRTRTRSEAATSRRRAIAFINSRSDRAHSSLTGSPFARRAERFAGVESPGRFDQDQRAAVQSDHYSPLGVAVLIAIFADIHANRQALTACLVQARERGAQRIALLGDYVGYG